MRKIPLSLDERMVEHFAASEPDAELEALAAAVKTAREEANSIARLEEAMRADTTLTDGAAALNVRAAALQSAEKVAARLDASRTRVLGVVENINKTTAMPAPPRDATALHLEGEIRAALKGMSDAQRKEALDGAVKDKNVAVIGAVLRGPAFLSGMAPERVDILRHTYRQTFHPGEHERLTRLSKALEATERAGNLFVGFVKEMSDSPAARLAESNKARRDEAVAAHSAGA